MNSELINRWNEVCDDESTVYHLGDFALCCNEKQVDQIISKLNFGKLILLMGNHEKAFKNWYYKIGSKRPDVEMHQYLEISHKGQKICMFHYPIASWNGKFRGSWMLSGHCHGNYQGSLSTGSEKILDVGVDTNNYYPYSYEQVAKIMSNKTNKTI